MKMIILAAGSGTRLKPITDDRPKCMVEVSKKSIIARQLETARNCGIEEKDIYVVAGYKYEVLEEYIKNTKVTLIPNAEYETTNMVHSLMCAKEVVKGEDSIIISYGDVFYTSENLKKLLHSENEISVIVDLDWESYWKNRFSDVFADAETLMYDEDFKLTEIGNKTTDIDRIQAQYIGLLKLRSRGIDTLLRICEKAESESDETTPVWGTGRSYRKIYMTDLLQHLIGLGERLTAVPIYRGWYEIDSKEDLRLAQAELEKDFG